MINSFEVKNISKLIKKKPILNNVSFKILKGEVIGIVGKNGSGKSSLFKIISGLWTKSSGNIMINGEIVNSSSSNYYKHLSSFIEYPNIYNNLTVRNNFDILISLNNFIDLDWFNFLIDNFKINEFMNIKVKNCSLGMKQKIGLTMSLMNDGDIIVLDEPSNSLDIDSVIVLHEIIEILKKKNKIILISSHIVEELENIVDKFIILDSGSIVSFCPNNNLNFYTVNFKKQVNDSDLLILKSINTILSIDDNIANINISNINEFINECNSNKLEIVSLECTHNKIKKIIMDNGD